MISIELVECIHQFLTDNGIAEEPYGQMIEKGSRKSYDYDAPYWSIAFVSDNGDEKFYTLGPCAGFPTEDFEYDYQLHEYQ